MTWARQHLSALFEKAYLLNAAANGRAWLKT
jgi:hypothetical protein